MEVRATKGIIRRKSIPFHYISCHNDDGVIFAIVTRTRVSAITSIIVIITGANLIERNGITR